MKEQELANQSANSQRLTEELTNGSALTRVFIPAPVPVPEDCFGHRNAFVSGRMVWEAVTPAAVSRDSTHEIVQSSETQIERKEIMMDAKGGQSDDLLCFEEGPPASPGFPNSDSYVEYDDLPDLQEVPEEAEPNVFQVDVSVSHQERHTQTPDTHWLTQLAVIATGPQSPLLQDRPDSSSSPVCLSSPAGNLHSYARPPPSSPTRALSPASGQCMEPRRNRKSSECGSAVSTKSSLSEDEDMGWSFSWPPTVWHCFLKGTRLRFHHGTNVEWQDVEELDAAEEDVAKEERSMSLKSYGSEGLQLVEHTEIVLSGQTVLQLTFDPGVFGHTPLTARCQLDHPFYVKDKGWTSFYPSLTVVHHGIPCHELEVGALCLPPGHRDAKQAANSLVCEKIRSYDFTPLDYSAVYVLSSMARRRRTSQSSNGTVSPDSRLSKDWDNSTPPRKTAKSQSHGAELPAGGSSATPTKCKRPMNAFMLFAKKFRVEYTQMYPGKDNRAISVLLGERWKKMRSEERRVFTVQAKALADEQKRINPDCWKRKRTNSGCQ